MGRIAGVTAEETRTRLLAAAAAAFESRGFEGTRVADIADDAGVSKGAMYAHFPSKAALLTASLAERASEELGALFPPGAHPSVLDLLLAFGQHLLERPPARGALVVEALVAARRDPEVAAAMRDHLRQRHDWLLSLLQQGQRQGAISPDLSPEALTRFCLMLVLGSALLPTVDLPTVDGDEWAALVAAVAGAMGAGAPAPRTPAEAP